MAILPCRASDSLLNQSRFSTINITKHHTYRVQLNSTDRLTLVQPATIAASIKIQEELPPYIGPEAIQVVSPEQFGRRQSTFPGSGSPFDRKIVFGKVPHSTARYYGQEQRGMLRNQNASIWKKAGRGEILIGGAELLGMGILMLMPQEVTKWQDDWLADAGRNITRAFTTAPVMDEDDWQFNYIGHPFAGALYYNTIRSQNATWFQSFLFSTAQSFIWEYVVEGIAEQPSIQDLIVTPVGGTILGEAFHQLTMGMRKNGFNTFEKVVTLVLNPMFVINNGYGPKYNPVFIK